MLTLIKKWKPLKDWKRQEKKSVKVFDYEKERGSAG